MKGAQIGPLQTNRSAQEVQLSPYNFNAQCRHNHFIKLHQLNLADSIIHNWYDQTVQLPRRDMCAF